MAILLHIPLSFVHWATILLVLAALTGDSTGQYTAEAEADRVAALPGTEELKSDLFSGYVTVDKEAGRALSYLFVEAEDPASAPLALWLSGGPGCSSIGGGFMSELGPFYPDPDTPGKLRRNQWAWTRTANYIFLDSPAFVGFSYSNTSSDRIVGDARTAADARAFMLGFLQRFPQYANTPFWITGESYAGHYVPNLALEILRGNEEDRSTPPIRLQGVMVGNPWTDPTVDNRGAADMWWTHSITSDAVYRGMLRYCNFTTLGPLAMQAAGSTLASGSLLLSTLQTNVDITECNRVVYEAGAEFGQINIYDIYVDICYPSSVTAPARQLGKAVGSTASFAAVGPLLAENGAYDPCVDDEVSTYMNLPEVQAALHVNQSGQLPGPWSDCSSYLQYSRKDLLTSELPVWQRLLQRYPRLQILIYSGDVDGIVPVIGTRRWTAGLGLPITDPWRPWHSLTGQVAGHTITYAGLTFASVRNAGHMVPFTQPERSYAMFTSFLHNQTLPM
ncbi:hypothetical protein WJX73_003210 [Symbiochloris irregularis]|uniref:Carboxypeptidase n=1 Tax=Symbiochloris irregularis TaxID=706552 RepID=A0AAW1PKB1_9CHLO